MFKKKTAKWTKNNLEIINIHFCVLFFQNSKLTKGMGIIKGYLDFNQSGIFSYIATFILSLLILCLHA